MTKYEFRNNKGIMYVYYDGILAHDHNILTYSILDEKSDIILIEDIYNELYILDGLTTNLKIKNYDSYYLKSSNIQNNNRFDLYVVTYEGREQKITTYTPEGCVTNVQFPDDIKYNNTIELVEALSSDGFYSIKETNSKNNKLAIYNSKGDKVITGYNYTKIERQAEKLFKCEINDTYSEFIYINPTKHLTIVKVYNTEYSNFKFDKCLVILDSDKDYHILDKDLSFVKTNISDTIIDVYGNGFINKYSAIVKLDKSVNPHGHYSLLSHNKVNQFNNIISIHESNTQFELTTSNGTCIFVSKESDSVLYKFGSEKPKTEIKPNTNVTTPKVTTTVPETIKAVRSSKTQLYALKKGDLRLSDFIYETLTVGINGNLHIAKLNGLVGIINSENEVIVPFEFKSIEKIYLAVNTYHITNSDSKMALLEIVDNVATLRSRFIYDSYKYNQIGYETTFHIGDKPQSLDLIKNKNIFIRLEDYLNPGSLEALPIVDLILE